MHTTDSHDAYDRTPADIAAVLRDDAYRAHVARVDEAFRLLATRARVHRRYGPNAAARVVAPVGQPGRPARADAGAGGPHPTAPVAKTRAPLPAAPPRPAPRGDVAVGLSLTGREMDRAVAGVWGRLRAALRLRIGEGVMPG